MNIHDKNGGGTLTIEEAVDVLSSLADLTFDHNSLPHQAIDLETLVQKRDPASELLSEKNGDLTMDKVKEIFRVIFHYFQQLYQNAEKNNHKEKKIEGIKTIMVLVGEAARKLDKYTRLFHNTQAKSVTELKEYKKLQQFYIDRIDRKIDQGMLGRWIMALAKKEKEGKQQLIGRESSQTKSVFIDLDSVKKDLEYELFFIRKNDGTRFFSPRLIQNLKLVNNFGGYLGTEIEEASLINPAVWNDRLALRGAKNIIRSCRKYIEKFYQIAPHNKERTLVQTLGKSLMGLMLAGNASNLTHNAESKNCADYFNDFQIYLRNCLISEDYRHLVAYPPQRSSKMSHLLVETIQVLCMAIYTQLDGSQELRSFVHGMIQHAKKEEAEAKASGGQNGVKKTLLPLAEQLQGDYAIMAQLMKKQGSGPIHKIIDAIEDGQYHEWDPLIHGNYPSKLFSLFVQEGRCLVYRWPTPTHQEFINKAAITEEFKAFLRETVHEHRLKKSLLINFQDRITWKEHYRCAAIEELQELASFDKHIDVVTLTRETEFYHQSAPYNTENIAEHFIKQFYEHLIDENCGYFFPKAMKKNLKETFIKDGLKAVHRIFFSDKNVLTKDQRMDFIEIFYLFLELKIIELSKPDLVGFTCKDGLDVTLSSSSLLYLFLKMLSQERLSEMDKEQVDLMLYGPILLERERVMIGDRFNRMLSAVKTIDSVRSQFGQANFIKIVHEAFGRLYQASMLSAKALNQAVVDEL